MVLVAVGGYVDTDTDMALSSYTTDRRVLIMKLLPQSWNDTLSLLGIIIIAAMWKWGSFPEGVNGALIVTWTLIWNFYFSKAPTEKH